MAVTFLQALNFAVVECDVSVVFKVAQVRALEAVYLGRDLIGVLPTGYGKSLIFQLIPDLISFKRHTMSSETGAGGRSDVQRDSVIIVVCPLDSLMANHSQSLVQRGLSSVVLRSGKIESVGEADKSDSDDEESTEQYELLVGRETLKKVQNGEFRVVFAHPEAIVASREGRALLQNKFFQSKVVACIVDEAHCIENW